MQLNNYYYTSLYIEEFELSARDTKLGKEEITCDIPNVSDEALAKLGEDGIVRIGAEVKSGDILVGKITPKSETELSPEERLLRAVFGDKAADVKDASLTVPPGTEGVVMDVKVFSRRDRLSRTDEEMVEETLKIKDIQREYKAKEIQIRTERHERIGALLLDEEAPSNKVHRKTAELILEEGSVIDEDIIENIENEDLENILMPENELYNILRDILKEFALAFQTLENQKKPEFEQVKKGDADLDPGIIRQVKVYVVSKRKLQVGDKMAGRHGNKGVVSIIVPEEDMPYLPNGEPIEIILNPLGVPSRMNIGQLLETHLGYAAKLQGINMKVPVFEGFPEEKIWEMMQKYDLSENGKFYLYDGRNGERFDNTVAVGYIYILKLSHLVADKIHARSIGPYSLVTQQPLGGKAQMGGQRFGEMEVWAVEAYGAANLLQELLTVKSDDVNGRTQIYESIVKGENILECGTPESFNVLVKEIQGLGLNIQPHLIEEKPLI